MSLGPPLAHEGRDLGELNFVVGFAEEPALEGQPNAVSLGVSRSEEAEERADEPGLEGHGAIFRSPILEAGDRFSYVVDIELVGDVQFPASVASLRGREGVARSTRDAAVTAGDEAGLARSLAIVAIAARGAGIAPGATGLWFGLRKDRRN